MSDKKHQEKSPMAQVTKSIAAVIVAVGTYFWFRKKKKKSRDSEDEKRV